MTKKQLPKNPYEIIRFVKKHIHNLLGKEGFFIGFTFQVDDKIFIVYPFITPEKEAVYTIEPIKAEICDDIFGAVNEEEFVDQLKYLFDNKEKYWQ